MIFTYKEIKIYYNIHGNGAPIVFLHGFLENSTMWKETIDLLSNTYTCVSIDLLGHGQTDCLGYIHTMEDMAIAVKAVLDHLMMTNITLVGHSMGGYVALAYIDLFPDEVSGLALVNSTSFPDSDERRLNRTRAISIVKKNPDVYTSVAIASLFAEKNRSKFVEEIRDIKDQASKTKLQGIISALEGMKVRKDRNNLLSHFKGPKIIFASTQDPVLDFTQNLLEAEQSKTKLVSLDGGHMSHIENKKELLSGLQKFLKQQ